MNVAVKPKMKMTLQMKITRADGTVEYRTAEMEPVLPKRSSLLRSTVNFLKEWIDGIREHVHLKR